MGTKSAPRSAHGIADRATDSSAFENTARVGFAASGVLHLLLAYIVLRIALGGGGNADQSGALATLAGQTGGKIMLWVVAIGLIALALWQALEANTVSVPLAAFMFHCTFRCFSVSLDSARWEITDFRTFPPNY